MKDIFDNKKEEETFESDWFKAFQSDNIDLKPIGFNGAYIQFHLRYAGDEEFEAVFKRVRELSDLPEEATREKLFAIYKDAIAKFSVKNPSLILNGKNIGVEGKDAAEAIEKLFPASNTKASRVLQKAWLDFRNANEPDVNFQ